MARLVVIDHFLTPGELIHADSCWPAPQWVGWHLYEDAVSGGKRVSDLVAPIPPFLSTLLARMAAVNLGAMVGMPEAVPDLSLRGGGLHEMPPGPGLSIHRDADTHPRLGLARAWSAILYVHPTWGRDWGGQLRIEQAPPVECRPGRLVVFDSRDARHEVLPVRCPQGETRRALALFGFSPCEGERKRPRADFGGQA